MAPRFQSGENNNLFLGAQKRRDIWPSAEEAYTFLKSRPTWKVWDDRILRIYVVRVLSFWYPSLVILIVFASSQGIWNARVADGGVP